MVRPRLSFACELGSEPLGELFADPAVLDALAHLGAGVALGLIDLSEERAAVAKKLNAAGIPAVAWLLLPEAQGYWFNADNAAEAATRYQQFRGWSAGHGLSWAGVGIDIEPDMRFMQALASGETGKALRWMLPRTFDGQRLRRAQAAYRALVSEIPSDGYPVESYQFPIIADERKAGSTLLQRMFGLVDVPVDREAFMLYSSFYGRLGPALLWSHASEARVVGIGSTGGGVEAGLHLPVLTREDFARDLRMARCFTGDVFVFSLEGCVRQDFLRRLIDFDWDAPVPPPVKDLRRLAVIRKSAQTMLWVSAHPLLIAGGALGFAWLLGRVRRR